MQQSDNYLFARISSRDTGKTMIDASLGEIMTTCEKLTWLLAEGEKWLKPEYRLNDTKPKLHFVWPCKLSLSDIIFWNNMYLFIFYSSILFWAFPYQIWVLVFISFISFFQYFFAFDIVSIVSWSGHNNPKYCFESLW